MSVYHDHRTGSSGLLKTRTSVAYGLALPWKIGHLRASWITTLPRCGTTLMPTGIVPPPARSHWSAACQMVPLPRYQHPLRTASSLLVSLKTSPEFRAPSYNTRGIKTRKRRQVDAANVPENVDSESARIQMCSVTPSVCQCEQLGGLTQGMERSESTPQGHEAISGPDAFLPGRKLIL